MKAQRIRKTLWLASLLLGAGVAGIGALVVVQKPAEAKEPIAKAKKVMEDYRKRTPTQVLQPSVTEEALKKEVLRPEWKGLPYWPYAGPKIPAPKPPEAAKPAVVEGPKDLAAIGRVHSLLFQPPSEPGAIAKDTIVYWEFSADKKKVAFVPGEYVVPNKDAAKRFKIVDVIREQPDLSRWRILYDVYEVPGDESKTRRAELIHDNEPKVTDADEKIMPGSRKPVPAAPAAGTATKPGADTGAVTAGAPKVKDDQITVVEATDPNDWRPTIRTKNSNTREVEFDENTFNRWKGKKMEDVLENVRLENYDKGGVKGVQIFPLDGNDMADKFDIKRNDVLISINGQPVTSKDDAIRVGRSLPKDIERVTVVIDRDGRQITYNVDPRDPKTRRSAATLVR
jgi:hypothetical protein